MMLTLKLDIFAFLKENHVENCHLQQEEEEEGNYGDGKDDSRMVRDGVEEEPPLLPQHPHQVGQHVCFNAMCLRFMF